LWVSVGTVCDCFLSFAGLGFLSFDQVFESIYFVNKRQIHVT